MCSLQLVWFSPEVNIHRGLSWGVVLVCQMNYIIYTAAGLYDHVFICFTSEKGEAEDPEDAC